MCFHPSMRVILSTISALLRPAWTLFTSSVHLSSVSLGFAFYGFVKSYDFSAKLTESIAISLEIPGTSTSKALIFFFFSLDKHKTRTVFFQTSSLLACLFLRTDCFHISLSFDQPKHLKLIKFMLMGRRNFTNWIFSFFLVFSILWCLYSGTIGRSEDYSWKF